MSAVFITATGTDIGKTAVAAALIRAARRRGLAVQALKPVVSSFDAARPTSSDPARLLEALDEPVTRETLARISPWQYRAPLAANMAARLEGREVPFGEIVAHCRALSAAAEGLLLLEGAGGVMSPLSDDHTNLDLILAVGAPALLVTGSYLGAISHTLTALEALRTRNAPVAAVVVSESASDAVPLPDTMAELARFAPGAPLLALPRLPDPERTWEATPLLELIGAHRHAGQP